MFSIRLCLVRSNEGARPGVSVFREAVGSLGWTESGSRTISRANPKSRTVKKVPTFPESTSSRLRKVRLSARADAGGPAVARTGRIVAEAGHGGKEKSAPPAAPRRAFLRFPKRRRRAILKAYSRAAAASYARSPRSPAPGRRSSVLKTRRERRARRAMLRQALKRFLEAAPRAGTGAAKPPQTKLRGLRVRIEPAAGSAFSALSA